MPFEVFYCAECRGELTSITRCEMDAHRTHHAYCCPEGGRQATESATGEAHDSH